MNHESTTYFVILSKNHLIKLRVNQQHFRENLKLELRNEFVKKDFILINTVIVLH